MDRKNTNEYIWEEANKKILENNPEAHRIETIEQTLNKRRIKFIGHILRADNNDPLRSMTFHYNSARPIEPAKRRVGGPKKHWTWESLRLVWNLIHENHPTPFGKTQTHLEKILEEAKNRKF